MTAVQVVEYLEGEVSPFGRWFAALNAPAASKITLYRLGQGHRANVKSVGHGISEYKVDFGPGYRIYFGQEGNMLIILLGGGTKKSQSRDIELAHQRWAAYQARK